MNNPLDIATLKKECQSAKANGLLHGLTVVAGTGSAMEVLWSWGDAVVFPARREMRPDMMFEIASLTKVVATASACAICVDRGLLDPDAPARDYLPQLGAFGDSIIRVRDLATHYSGFDNRKFDQYAPDELVPRAIEAPAQWPAGERFEYSCRNFIILGYLVEQVTGLKLATFCERNIFAPLGMSHTTFGPLRNGLEHVVPTNQSSGTISDEQARKADGPIGNAGLFSSGPDLALFCQMVLNRGNGRGHRLLGKKGLGWLMQPCSPKGLPQPSFGWDMRPCPENLQRPGILSPSAIGHGGWTGQTLWIDPDLDRFIVILTNRTHAQQSGTADTHDPAERFRGRFGNIVLSNLAL